MLKKIKENLLAMDGRCVGKEEDESYTCMYRDGNGKACAVGAFITDEEYEPEMESLPVGRLRDQYPKLGIWDMMSEVLWGEVQCIHDASHFGDATLTVDEWKEHVSERMDALIRRYPKQA